MRNRIARFTARVTSRVLCLGVVCLLSLPAAAVVVPGSAEFVNGNAANCVPTTGCVGFQRYQQVFAASEFSERILITEIRFRRDAFTTTAFSHSFSSVTIQLSTTAVVPDGLSSNFASNQGGDLLTVRSGSLTLASASSSGDPAPFDIVVVLDTPFLYDPDQGNLLLDWINLGGEDFGGLFYDAVNTAGDVTSRAFAGPSGSATGTVDTQGLVVEFAQVLDDGPLVVELIDASGGGASLLDSPTSAAVDAAGNVLVAGASSDNVFRITPDGTVTEILDASGNGTSGLNNPTRPVVDAAGNVFVAGSFSDNVFRVTPDGTITEILDASGDGTSVLLNPGNLAVDAAGNVLAAGNVSSNVFRVTPGGATTEVLDPTGDGLSGLAAPEPPAVDAAGNVFVAGSNSDNLFRLTFSDFSDDFDAVGSGIGWDGAWGPGAEYVEDFPVDLGRPRHVRTSAFAFRFLDPIAALRLDAADEVWIAFDIRLDRLKNTSEFAGLSFFDSANAEVFFAGGVFDRVPWGVGSGASLTTEPTVQAGAEWARLMVRLDFADTEIDFFVDGVLEASGTDLPERDWASVRLASGANRAYVDRLYIGRSRDAVEVAERPRYAAADGAKIVLLDGRREQVASGADLGALSTASGLATDGVRIFYADSNTGEIVATALNGTQEIFRWIGPSDPTGLTLLAGKLAVLEPVDGSIDFYASGTGAFLGFINHQCFDGSDAEALAFDGTLLWVSCQTELEALDPDTGTLVDAVPNAASGCLGGRGLTVSATGDLTELTLSCSNGDWFRVLAATGEVIDSGNNGLGMGGITYLPEPDLGILLMCGLFGLALIGASQKSDGATGGHRGGLDREAR